ncbi:MAG: glucose-1-phosphate thymidylyltransferase RfbA [Acidiferrobacterales bacterium]|nr:glucose-1-phosphate thymidylyltransferase RfbA [Acidiferrobacterales bacterium]
MSDRKGIILAGGSGSRLYPVTMAVSKSLLPIYNKPMIYYPLSVLMLSGVRDIAIITVPQDQHLFERVLEDGSQWGIHLSYISQPSPDGLAQAYILAEEYLAGSCSVMILGDNLYFGHSLPELLNTISTSSTAATVFAYQVADPQRYGVVEVRSDGQVKSLVEKPTQPESNLAVTGLYYLDETASERAKQLNPSERGELEITSLLQSYLDEDRLSVEILGRGIAWFDTGTHVSLLDAGNFVRTVETRQGLQIGSPDEIAFDSGWIDDEAIEKRLKLFANNEYGRYLERVLRIRSG